MADQPSRNAFRPIAPRTSIEPLTINRYPEETRAKRASAACFECKRRRTKCVVDNIDGPCTECALHGRECRIDESEDKRRKVNAKKTEEERDYYRAYTEYLIDAIRYGQFPEIMNLVAAIQEGGGDEAIHFALSQFPRLAGSFNLKVPSESPPNEPKDQTSRKRGLGP
ncbi:hypothetical protein BJX99DRAFT_115074 [Aspergillus californicus]